MTFLTELRETNIVTLNDFAIIVNAQMSHYGLLRS